MMTTNDKYWSEYDGLQNAKHAILKKYLDGWFPKITSFHTRVLYIDCHAGRGRHKTGQEGSPIIALKCLLNHQSYHSIINKAIINYIFFEKDQENYEFLLKEIQTLKKSPNMKVLSYHSDYETILQQTFTSLHEKENQLAPCFAFLDPFGFDLSMKLMNDFLSFQKSELFITFMYRYVNMAIMDDALVSKMDQLFGTTSWRRVKNIQDPELREKNICDIFSNQLRAKWVTSMKMLSSTNTTKYVLFHATNHPSGRDLMKSVMWSVSPEGSFIASERHNPNQLTLLTAEPNLLPLKNVLVKTFSGQSLRMEELYQWLRGEIYLEKHLHIVLRGCNNENLLEFSDYKDRFAFNKNPMVHFK